MTVGNSKQEEFYEALGSAVATATSPLRLLQAFLNNSKNLCWVSDAQQQLLYANPALYTYLGAHESLLYRDVYHIFEPHFAGAVIDGLRQVQRNRQPHYSTVSSGRADGSVLYFSLQLFPIDVAPELQLIGGIATDITEQQQVEQRLYECNEKWMAFARQASQGLWEWHLEDGFVSGNDALKKLLLLPTGASLSLLQLFRQLTTSDRQQFKKILRRVLRGHTQSWEQEYVVQLPDGSQRTLLDRGFAITANGKPVKLISTVLDITEIKGLEQTLKKERDRRRQQEAELILHTQEQERTHIGRELHDNINQMLVSAKLYLGLLQPTADEHACYKQKALGTIEAVINEIRTLSKNLAAPHVHYNGLVTAIEDLVEDLKDTSKLQLRFHYNTENFEGLSAGQRLTLFRIVQEQTKNILQHSHAVLVVIELLRKNGTVLLNIEDDGIGFDPKAVRRGIGLSNIFERTQLCGGRAAIWSRPRGGCLLQVQFPWHDPSVAEPR